MTILSQLWKALEDSDKREVIHGIVEFIFTGLLGWIAFSCWNFQQDAASIKAQLDNVPPAEVREEVRALRSDMLTLKDVEYLLSKSSPWAKESAEWGVWRREIDGRLLRVELLQQENRVILERLLSGKSFGRTDKETRTEN